MEVISDASRENWADTVHLLPRGLCGGSCWEVRQSLSCLQGYFACNSTLWKTLLKLILPENRKCLNNDISKPIKLCKGYLYFFWQECFKNEKISAWRHESGFFIFFFSRVKEALGVFFVCWFVLIGDPRQPPKNSVFWFLPSLFSCHSVSHWTSSLWEAQEMGWSPTAPGKPFRDTDV